MKSTRKFPSMNSIDVNGGNPLSPKINLKSTGLKALNNLKMIRETNTPVEEPRTLDKPIDKTIELDLNVEISSSSEEESEKINNFISARLATKRKNTMDKRKSVFASGGSFVDIVGSGAGDLKKV